MYRIAKSFTFCAAHHLPHLGPDHPCARVHGHNYTVVLVMQAATVDPDTGMVRDFRSLDSVKRWIDFRLDHQDLNEVVPAGMYTTSELLARWMLELWQLDIPELVCVRVRETERTSAEYWKPGVRP